MRTGLRFRHRRRHADRRTRAPARIEQFQQRQASVDRCQRGRRIVAATSTRKAIRSSPSNSLLLPMAGMSTRHAYAFWRFGGSPLNPLSIFSTGIMFRQLNFEGSVGALQHNRSWCNRRDFPPLHICPEMNRLRSGIVRPLENGRLLVGAENHTGEFDPWRRWGRERISGAMAAAAGNRGGGGRREGEKRGRLRVASSDSSVRSAPFA